MPGLETLALIISSLATTTFAANALYLGTYALALGGLAYAQSLFVDKPSVPKPEDGTFNLKQNVPSLAYVMGWSKKGGDYAFLEEKNGVAYHVIVAAAHEIEGYIQHYLHDEQVLLDETGFVAAPQHFTPNVVKILERTGLPAETAYPDLLTVFPTIYSEDHRGDGLASIMMSCRGVSQKYYMKVYPNQMPQWSGVVAGAKLFDPRTETVAFTRNLALMRLWHLTHPVGGKLSLDDMYLPDFAHAADVCAELVVNRDGENEPRYFGGFWFRANNDPTEVGRIMDQAAELVIFERPDGLVGCHAGEFVEPDITLTRNDVISFNLDGNTRDTSNVLAVRGRYVRLDLDHATADAAIYGDPYVDGDDTERTKTIDNNAIQSHNHVQRMQKIAFIRANAPRVSIMAHYEPAENVPYRRFVWVNIPPKLDMVLVEITETPKLSLRNLTIEFAGIIVPADLYAFDAATEEGEPGNDVILLENGGVPMPTDFDVVIQRDTVNGSNNVAYGLGSWAHYSDDLTYEFEWQPSDASEPPRSILSEPEEDQVRSSYLIDGRSYRFRVRAWGGGTQSDWTDYVTRVAIADPVAPAALTVFTQTAPTPHLGNAVFSLTVANDPRVKSVKLYRKASGVPLDVDVDAPIATLPVASSIAATYGHTDGDVSRSNLISGGDFAAIGTWAPGTGWSVAAGVASKAVSGSDTNILQPVSLSSPAGKTYRGRVEIASLSGGTLRPLLTGGTTAFGPSIAASGNYLFTITGNASNANAGMRGVAAAVTTLDNYVLYEQSLTCAPQGDWDYYAVPFNGSGVDGPPSGPVAVIII